MKLIKVFFVIYIIQNLFNIVQIQCEDCSADAGDKIMNVCCPELQRTQVVCADVSDKFKKTVDQFQQSDVFKKLNEIKGTKENPGLKDTYESLQKQAQACRDKASVQCQTVAQQAFDSLTQMYATIAELMNFLRIYAINNPDQIPLSLVPKPIIATQAIENFTYSGITNYDKKTFYQAVSSYISQADQIDDSFMDKFRKISKLSNDYQNKYNNFKTCLDTVSANCHPLTQSAYDTLTALNKDIYDIMNELHTEFPTLIDAPIAHTVTLPEGYSYYNVDNFNGSNAKQQAFSNAISKFRDNFRYHSGTIKSLYGQMSDCQDHLINAQEVCTDRIKEVTGLQLSEADIEKYQAGPNAALNMGANLGEFVLIESSLAEFGVPGLAAGAIAIGISFIPVIGGWTDTAVNWVTNGLFSIFGMGQQPLSIKVDPSEIILHDKILQEIKLGEIKLQQKQLGQVTLGQRHLQG